jgi:hypothetical protein
MEPYLSFAVALMQGADPTAELEAIRQLPIEKRYVWRVASALKWAFADFDDLSVSADKETLTPEDFLQCDGPHEIAAHAVLPFLEGAGGCGGNAEVDDSGDQGCETGVEQPDELPSAHSVPVCPPSSNVCTKNLIAALQFCTASSLDSP